MKVKTGLFFFLFCIGNYLLAQSNQLRSEKLLGNFETVTTDSAAQLSLNNNALVGTWAENTFSLSNFSQMSVESERLPSEMGYYIGQSSFEFLSFNRFVIIEVSYDNVGWRRLAQNSFTTGQFSPGWVSPGLHTMDIRYWYVDGLAHSLNFKVYVVPPRDKIYYDGTGNWVSVWTGTTESIDRPVIVVEGFDPVNTTGPDYFYGKAANFFGRIRRLDADVMIFNFADGGREIGENAQIIQGFVRYIESIREGNQKIILAGLSMGGVIARCALAEAEQENQPLNVSHFLSIDSPQQGAMIPRDLQDYINENDNGVPKPSLNAVAAREMLFYNTYDPLKNTDHKHHDLFYNFINSLNGNGYPHNCINVGVSFAPNKRNPNLGEWLTVEIGDLLEDKHFYLWDDNECKVAGSYLPTSATAANGFSWGVSWKLTRHLDPTFIPYTSALDIVNGVTKFDRIINSSQFNYHDSFPEDIVKPIAYEIGLLPDSYTNVVFKNLVNENIDAGGSLKVTALSGMQYPISSGDFVYLLANQQHTVETIDRYRLNFSSTGISYQHSNWNKIPSEFKTKKIFKGWDNNGSQEAYFSKIDKITIKNDLENILSSGDIDFKDPWFKIGDNQPNDFYSIISPFTPGDGNYISYGGIFLNQDPTFDPIIPNYSIRAHQPLTIPINGINRAFYFQNWSTNTATSASFQSTNALETGVVFNEANATVSANYKGTQLSNTSNAFANNSQRKYIKTTDGSMHLVYESMGKVWYERSTDNGTTWQIMNNGKPVTISGKNPAIDANFDLQNPNASAVVIVYLTDDLSIVGTGTAIVADYYDNGNKIFSSIVANFMNSMSGYTIAPVVAMKYDYKILIAWSDEGTINYRFGYPATPGNYFDWYNQPTTISTTTTATQLSITGCKHFGETPPAKLFHLVWQENNDIYYTSFSSPAYNQIVGNSISNMSSNHYAQTHMNPSVIEINGEARIVWKSEYDVFEDGEYISPSIVFHSSDYPAYWDYGNYTDVNSPVINRPEGVTAYVFSWTENNGSVGKLMDNYLSAYRLRTIATTGKDMQLSNGSTLSNMYALQFNNTALPYNFNQSNNIGSYYGLLKENSNASISVARTGVAIKEKGRFFYSLGDIYVDNGLIEFEELDRNNTLATKENLTNSIVSKPFVLGSTSSLTYSVTYGMNNTTKGKEALGDNGEIHFRVEVLDANTNEVLGSFDEMKYSKMNLAKYSNIGYKVNAPGLLGKSIKLRLHADDNLEAKYVIVENTQTGTNLAKKTFKEVELKQNEVITDYGLNQNYPNPFNPATTITYQLPKSGSVTIKIYDMLGKEVKTLVNEQQEMGRYTVQFDASSLASGMYVYQLRVNDYTSTKKMLLLK